MRGAGLLMPEGMRAGRLRLYLAGGMDRRRCAVFAHSGRRCFGAEAIAKAVDELDEVRQTGCLRGSGFAKGKFGFKKEAGEGGVQIGAERGGGCDASLRLIAGAAEESGAALAKNAGGTAEGEVELEEESGTGALVEEIGGGGIGGGEAFVEEYEVEVAAAEGGEGGATMGRRFDLGGQVTLERVEDGRRGGFGGDEQDQRGHGAVGRGS